MKSRKSFLFLIILLASFQISFGQEKPKAYLIDEFGKPCSEDLMARYDGFLIQLNQNPLAIGYIIFYGDDELEGRNLNFITYLTLIYPQAHRLDKSRIVLIRGENRAEMKIQFWLVPAGANPPKPEREFVEEKITSTSLFDRNRAEFNRWSGRLDIYYDGFLDLGCEFRPNVGEFANTLLSNPELTGYLIVYTEFGKGIKYGNRVASFAVVDLMNDYKVPRNRLKTIYGGNREEPEIELWFVPKGDKPPTPKPVLKSKK
jgi:hypothetical protein